MNQRTSALLAFSSQFLLVSACDRQPKGALSNSPGIGMSEPSARVPDTVRTTLSAAKPAPEPSGGDPMSKLDPDMKAVLDQLAALSGKPIESLDALEARKQPSPADAVRALLLKQGNSAAPDPVEQVSEHTAQLSSGALPIRIDTPRTGRAPYPVILYFHGGGFVIANNDAYDASARALANGAEAVVLAAEYRKAPENKFPAAHDDAIESYEWTLRNASSFGGNPRKVAVVGESAGGNLAVNVSIAARDTHERLPVWEVLIYPVVGSYMSMRSSKAQKRVCEVARAHCVATESPKAPPSSCPDSITIV